MKNRSSTAIRLFDQDLVLLPERALFWRQQRMLVAADPHFAKAQVFRERGIPLPGGTTASDLGRLSRLIERFKPERLLILGDLVHGRIDHGRIFERIIARWRDRHRSVEMLLVSGNHDGRAGGPPAAFRFDRTAEKLKAGPFFFSHKPGRGRHSGYIIAGHLHPAVRLSGKGRQKEILPCFCFGAHRGLLPAFGSFTGRCLIHPARGDRVIAVAGDEVIAVTGSGGGKHIEDR